MKRTEGGDCASGVTPARPVRARFRGRPRASPGRRRVSVTPQSQSALFDETRRQNVPFRHVAAPGRCGATPPPGCGALWRMPQLGRCARATPRQAAGRVARGSADLGSESGLTERRTLQPHLTESRTLGVSPSRRSTLCTLDLTENRTLRVGPHGKAQCAWLPAHRVRFLVRRADRMRFSVGRRRVCPGEEKRTLRKTALCASDLTERRTLGESPSRKGAFWLRALGGGAFPPVVFEHVTESSATVRAEWDDRLPAQVHRSQK